MAPYEQQIAALRRQVGAVFPRQVMKDCSGASMMDPKTQVTRVTASPSWISPSSRSRRFALPLVHEIADENDRALLDVAVAGEVNLVGDPVLVAADAARDTSNAPNSVMAAAASIIGPRRVERALKGVDALIDLFAQRGLDDARDETFDLTSIEVDPADRALFLAGEADQDVRPELMIKAVRARGARSIFLKLLEIFGAPVHRDAVLAAIAATIAGDR